MANINATVPSAPIATFGGSLRGVANEGRIAANLAGTCALVASLSTWTFGTVAAAPIATFGGSATAVVLDNRMAATAVGTSTFTATATTWTLGTVASSPVATFGGTATGDVFDGQLSAAIDGTGSVVGNLRDVLDGAILAFIASAPIATFGGSGTGIIFDGRMAGSGGGVGSLVGTLNPTILGAIASAPIATFGGSGTGIIFDGRMAAALAGTGTLAGTVATTNLGTIASAPIATFGGRATAIVTDGAIGYILPGAIATFGGSAIGYSYAPRATGHGVGRTHLFLGEISPLNPVAGPSADLYVLTDAYGAGEGTATALLLETPDIAPLGVLGRWRARLLSCPIQYDANCTLRITPIVDYMTAMDPLIVSFGAPGQVTRRVLQVKILRACTTLRVRIEALTWAGPIEFYTPTLYLTPLKRQSGMTFGEAP